MPVPAPAPALDVASCFVDIDEILPDEPERVLQQASTLADLQRLDSALSAIGSASGKKLMDRSHRLEPEKKLVACNGHWHAEKSDISKALASETADRVRKLRRELEDCAESYKRLACLHAGAPAHKVGTLSDCSRTVAQNAW